MILCFHLDTELTIQWIESMQTIQTKSPTNWKVDYFPFKLSVDLKKNSISQVAIRNWPQTNLIIPLVWYQSWGSNTECKNHLAVLQQFVNYWTTLRLSLNELFVVHNGHLVQRAFEVYTLYHSELSIQSHLIDYFSKY